MKTKHAAETYPRRKVSGGAERATEHRQGERSDEQDDRQEEHVGKVATLAAVSFQQPVPVGAGVRQQTAGTDEHLVVRRVAVVVQARPVPAERRVEPGFQITSEIPVPVVRLVVDLQSPVHHCATLKQLTL